MPRRRAGTAAEPFQGYSAPFNRFVATQVERKLEKEFRIGAASSVKLVGLCSSIRVKGAPRLSLWPRRPRVEVQYAARKARERPPRLELE